MRTFTFNFVSVFVGVLIASGLFAQSETISLSRALELSKQNNLTLQQQTRRLEQARAALAAQKAEYFPAPGAAAALYRLPNQKHGEIGSREHPTG